MENLSERIQEYIEGQLSEEEVAQFEAQLVVDSELRNLLALQREVHEILNNRVVSKEVELRETLNVVSNNFRHQSTAKVFSFKRWLPVLAAACVLVIGFLFFFNQSNDLFSLPKMHSEIVRGHEKNIVYEKAVNTFNTKDYKNARVQLESLLLSNPNQVQYQYYLGLTYLGEKDMKSTIQILNPIAEGESVFSEEAKYYLAIAYHENKENNKAIKLLQEIDVNGSLGEKANKLLDKIN